jgi:hypothetical protein
MSTLTNLDNEIIKESALEAFVKTLLPFTRFSRNFSPEPVQKGQNVLVPLIAALTATTFGGSYSICGGTQTVVTVSINRHKVVHLGQDDLTAANSSRANLRHWSFQQGRALAITVLQDVFTLITTANFTSVSAVGSTALTVAELRLARLRLNQDNVPTEPRALILDCVPYDSLLGITNFVQAQMFKDTGVLQEGRVMRALGMDIFDINDPFISGASVMGFACHPEAIAVAMRYLQPQEGNTYLTAEALSDPETGIVMGLRDYYDNASGTRYKILEANYGYSTGITNGGRILKRTD